MTLAQVQATVAFITFLMATWAGLIIAMALLMPKQSARAETEMTDSPVRSFFIGLGMLIPLSISLGIVRLPSGGAKLIGFLALVAIGAALAVGASGMALVMGRRISQMTGDHSAFSGLVRGSIVYSLALGFPLIGWFLFMPVALIISLGAGTRAFIRASENAFPPASPGKPQYDILERQGAV